MRLKYNQFVDKKGTFSGMPGHVGLPGMDGLPGMRGPDGIPGCNGTDVSIIQFTSLFDSYHSHHLPFLSLLPLMSETQSFLNNGLVVRRI